MGTGLNTIILSLLLFYRALGYLVSVQNEWHGFIENIGGMNSVAIMAEKMDELKEKDGAVEFETLHQGISFKNVAFGYDKVNVLRGINLDIPARSTVAFIGESGVGKTTAANMIAGLVRPVTGELFLDNTELNDIKIDGYRDKIGYISQEVCCI